MIVGTIYLTVSYRTRELWNEKYEPGFVIHEHHERGRVVMRPYWYPDLLCDTQEEATKLLALQLTPKSDACTRLIFQYTIWLRRFRPT